MATILSSLSRVPRRVHVALALALVLVVGGIDYVTGDELSVSLFYALPIFVASWFVSRRAGIAVSVLCAVDHLLVDPIAHASHFPRGVVLWNVVVELGFFVTFTLLLVGLKSALDRERALARTDGLTGLANARSFFERLQLEVDRSRRDGTPTTLVYIDLDDFKRVNDQQGHTEGDRVLREVARAIAARLRATDLVARLGGDEFGMLLPATASEEARVVLHTVLGELRERIRRGGWPISLSVGALTFTRSSLGVDELMRRADALMYGVKAGGKNGVLQEELAEPGTESS